MKPTVTEPEISAVFRADGVALAGRFDEAISDGLRKSKATQIDTLAEELVSEDHALRSEQFREWDQVIKALALRGWPELRNLKVPETEHVQRTRLAVRWWLRKMFPELGLPEDLEPLAGEPGRHRRSRTDADLNKALEDHAMKVAEGIYRERFGPANVTRVAHLPRALDLLVKTPDGNLRVEVKGRKGPARQVDVTDGEVDCSHQAEPCVLFVVDSITVDFDTAYACQGGRWREYPWRVREGDPSLRATSFAYTLGTPTAYGKVNPAA